MMRQMNDMISFVSKERMEHLVQIEKEKFKIEERQGELDIFEKSLKERELRVKGEEKEKGIDYADEIAVM